MFMLMLVYDAQPDQGLTGSRNAGDQEEPPHSLLFGVLNELRDTFHSLRHSRGHRSPHMGQRLVLENSSRSSDETRERRVRAAQPVLQTKLLAAGTPRQRVAETLWANQSNAFSPRDVPEIVVRRYHQRHHREPAG